MPLSRELRRTAEMLVEIAEKQGVYFVVAFLHDANYDPKRIAKLMPYLEKQDGAIKKVDGEIPRINTF